MSMQKVDEQKRIRILEAAGRLFAARPLHEVRLEDIAAEANIGKGTIYVYFKGKTDLCVSLFIEAMARTTAEIQAQLQDSGLTLAEKIDRVIRTLLSLSRQYPNMPNMIRELSLTPEDLRPLTARRQQMVAAIEGVLRDGISRGEVDDPHPELTARLLLAFVREVTFHTTPQVDHDVFIQHLRHILTNGVFARGNQ
jgi:AcrR family transcriptional regulator